MSYGAQGSPSPQRQQKMILPQLSIVWSSRNRALEAKVEILIFLKSHTLVVFF